MFPLTDNLGDGHPLPHGYMGFPACSVKGHNPPFAGCGCICAVQQGAGSICCLAARLRPFVLVRALAGSSRFPYQAIIQLL